MYTDDNDRENDEQHETWVPLISEFEELNVFCDELTAYADVIKQLPYGMLSLLVVTLRDIISEEDETINPADWDMYTKVFYFMSGILLSKSDKTLEFTTDDVDILYDIMNDMITSLSFVEGYFAGNLKASYTEDDNGMGWTFRVNRERIGLLDKKFKDALAK